MKQFIFFFLASACLFTVDGANIEWDFLHYNNGDIGAEVYAHENNRLDVFFDINMKKFGNDTYLWASENDLRRGSLAPVQSWNSGAWLEAYVGDLVDASTIFGRHDYWFYEMANAQPEYGYGEPKIIEFDKSYYLMFAIEDMDDAWAYRLKETTEPPQLYYGWAEYAVSEDGTFKILNSAIDFDGGPMIVGFGAVPEPASGLLIILGIASLTLRRCISITTRP